MHCCEACGSIVAERHYHIQQMDAYHELFAQRHRDAVQEFQRLKQLMCDVAWYNFETVARAWRYPWPVSMQNTSLTLHGMRCEHVQSRRGRRHEKSSFPVYYSGKVCKAPPLPPQILLNELQVAYEHVKDMEIACAAPYEWAPGGRLYEQMVRESPGVAAFSSNAPVALANERKHGGGLLLGDQLEREVSTDAETTAKDILGRICGDRPLVRARVDSRRAA